MLTRIALPNRVKLRDHIISALASYIMEYREEVQKLPISETQRFEFNSALRLVEVQLPNWGRWTGIDGVLLVPEEAASLGDAWYEIDWWLAAFVLLECWHERIFEERNGPIHSYSSLLIDWDERAWDSAWVNRIGLFLRAWVENEKYPAVLPEIQQSQPKIFLTHDVDAIRKTLQIRIKQCTFLLFNAFKFFWNRDFSQFRKRFKQGISFLLSSSRWDYISKIVELERNFGVESSFNIYVKSQDRGIQGWFLDPSYSLEDECLKWSLTDIISKGLRIGLHSSVGSWMNSAKLSDEKNQLEEVIQQPVLSIRQHWLKFSWEYTWDCQAEAGFIRDETLMFNDRSGFRNSACLLWTPWSTQKNSESRLRAIPTVLMDSHLFDYSVLPEENHHQVMDKAINEIVFVGGAACFLWHPHTLSRDYGWENSFLTLLKRLSKVGFHSHGAD